MAELEPRPAAGGDRSAAERFADELRQLRHGAGKPSFRAMAQQVGSISHTTLHEAESGSRLPSWTTTSAFVRACGGDETEWRCRWARATGAAADQPGDAQAGLAPAEELPAGERTGALAASPLGPVGEARVGSGGSRLRRSVTLRRRAGVLTHVLALLVGVLIGAGLAVGLVDAYRPAAATSPQDCPVGDIGAPPVRQPGPVTAEPAGPAAAAVRPVLDGAGTAAPSWVARPASDQQILTGTGVVLPVESPVSAGDTLIVTMMLTSTCPGTVTVTDTRGDRYETVGDETDSRRHRVLVLASFGAHPLTTADSIHVGYPHASKYHIAVDEFRGISTARGTARAHGESGGTAFTTSSSPATCAPGDLLVGAVGTNTGTAPEFSGGWTTLPVLKLSSYRLTTAWQTATADGPCAATGLTTAQWGAVLAVFR